MPMVSKHKSNHSVYIQCVLHLCIYLHIPMSWDKNLTSERRTLVIYHRCLFLISSCNLSAYSLWLILIQNRCGIHLNFRAVTLFEKSIFCSYQMKHDEVHTFAFQFIASCFSCKFHHELAFKFNCNASYTPTIVDVILNSYIRLSKLLTH